MEAWNPARVMSEPQQAPPSLVPVTIPGRSEPLNVRPEVAQAAEQKDAEALLQAPTFNDETGYFSPPAESSVRPERIVPSNTSNGLTPYQYAQYSFWADAIRQNTSTYPSVEEYKRVVGL